MTSSNSSKSSSKSDEAEAFTDSNGLRRRGSASSESIKRESPRLLIQDQDPEEKSDHESTPETSPSPPLPHNPSHIGRFKRLLGLDYFFGSSTSTKITPENIYATANISAFAALLSLVCILSLHATLHKSS